MSTNKAADKSGGNLELQSSNPKMVITGAAGVPGCPSSVENGETFLLFGGAIRVKCFTASGEHVLYYLEAASACADDDDIPLSHLAGRPPGVSIRP